MVTSNNENMLSIEELKNLRIEDCSLSGIGKFKHAVQCFSQYILSGELTEEEFFAVRKSMVYNGWAVLSNVKLFLKFNPDLKLECLQKDMEMIKEMILNIDSSYSKVKKNLEDLMENVNIYKVAARDRICLWDNVMEKSNKTQIILEKHKNNKRCEDLFLYVGRVIVYFLDSLNQGDKQLNVLDGISKTVAELESYGLRDSELELIYDELRLLTASLYAEIEKIKSSYPKFCSKNPYVFYTEKDFSKALKVFKSDMKKKVRNSLLVNLGECFLLVWLFSHLNITNETLVVLASAGIGAIPNICLYNKFNNVLADKEVINDQIQEVHDYYEEEKEKYLKLIEVNSLKSKKSK